jgi:Fe-S oxidoreductase
VLHGHCHQKALWGVDSSAALLRRLVGDQLRVLDSGCCGMAGSFGYTEDHYDLSMKIGEVVLFPAVRAAAGETIVAPGTSCRHQIKDGTGVTAVHPIEAVASLLGV